MKKRTSPFVLMVCLCASQMMAQGTFQNLNFEQATIPVGTQPGTFLPTSSAMPGWNATVGVAYDIFSLGGALISISDSNLYSGFVVPQGKYCAYLFGGFGSASNIPATISQTGMVPAGTESLRIDASLFNTSTFVVTLGGQTINMVPLSSTPAYTVYGGDISSFAGQIADLSFTAPAPSGPDPSGLLLDDVTFSTSPVPEPGAWVLMVCGGAGLWKVRRLKAWRERLRAKG